MTGATLDEVWPLVRDHHYSRRMPSATRHTFAWRESGGLFGDTGAIMAACLFGNPVNRSWCQESLELQRLVRLPQFDRPLSEFVAWCLRWLKANTNTPFVISYADEGQGHHGGIYQALGFTYIGHRQATDYPDSYRLPDGTVKHRRQVGRELGSNAPHIVMQKKPNWEPVANTNKHIYIKPLRQRKNAVIRRIKKIDNDSRFRWLVGTTPKPDHAARPEDAPVPTDVS